MVGWYLARQARPIVGSFMYGKGMGIDSKGMAKGAGRGDKGMASIRLGAGRNCTHRFWGVADTEFNAGGLQVTNFMVGGRAVAEFLAGGEAGHNPTLAYYP